MPLRWVLLTVMAGLGLTAPSYRDLGTLSHSAQRWIQTRLAERNCGTPIDEDAFIYVLDPENRVPETTARPAVSDAAFAAVIEETVATFVQDVAPAPSPRAAAIAEAVPEVGTSEVLDDVVFAPSIAPAASEPESTVVNDQAFDVIMADLAAKFVADLAAMERRNAADRAFDAVIDEMAAHFAADLAATAMNGETGRPTPSFEPLDVPQDLYTGEAYALNRASEGIDLHAPAAAGKEDSQRDGTRWTQAVRLTREAVFAWGSLLHGPAVVTIPR